MQKGFKSKYFFNTEKEREEAKSASRRSILHV